MKPQDISVEQFIAELRDADVQANHPGLTTVALADGDIEYLSFQTDEKTLRALITRSGGESVEVFDR